MLSLNLGRAFACLKAACKMAMNIYFEFTYCGIGSKLYFSSRKYT